MHCSGNQLDAAVNGKGHQIFVSSITQHIPGSTAIRLEGDKRADKKSSQDSAALALLLQLEKQNWCQIELQ